MQSKLPKFHNEPPNDAIKIFYSNYFFGARQLRQVSFRVSHSTRCKSLLADPHQDSAFHQSSAVYGKLECFGFVLLMKTLMQPVKSTLTST